MKRTGFQAAIPPGVSSLTSRQAQMPNNAHGINKRKMIHWLLANGTTVQMYINPDSLVISNNKSIISTRTKGGFALQYFGEELQKLSINGTTGSSGIEGINVLRDVYRSEHLAFEPYALNLAALNNKNQSDGIQLANSIFGESFSSWADVGNSIADKASALVGNIPSQEIIPSLAELAFTIEMYWSGEVYRGYFESFSVTEKADSLGLFNYEIKFVAIQKRGIRQNFLAWHRSATDGPSNSNKEFGTPYSFDPDTGSVRGSSAPRTTTQGDTSVGADIVDRFGKLF